MRLCLQDDDPVNKKNTQHELAAGAYNVGILTEDEAKKLPTFPDNYVQQLVIDPSFYIGQLSELTERFDMLIQQ